MVLSSFCVYCMMMTWLTMMATTSSEPNATWKMNFYGAFVFHRHRFCQFLTNESWKSVVGAARSAKCKIASEETERLWKTANNCSNYRIEHTHTHTYTLSIYLHYVPCFKLPGHELTLSCETLWLILIVCRSNTVADSFIIYLRGEK